MDEVVVDRIHLQALERAVEVGVEIGHRRAFENRQLGGQLYLFAQAGVAGEDLAKRSLAAVVNIGGVEVVYALLDGGEDELLGCLEVYARRHAGEAHAAESEGRKLVAVLGVCAELHEVRTPDEWTPRKRGYVSGVRAVG